MAQFPQNPYTLVFGQPPLEFVNRMAQAERIISDFCQERPSNYINLITGIRGSGKTVFLTQVVNTIKKKDPNWIIVDLNPQRDLLESLAAKLSSQQKLRRFFEEAEINLQAFGIGIGVKGIPPINDIEEALSRMLQSLKKHRKRLLITIDEAGNSKNMRIFASAFQIFLRNDLPVFLLMTGLYKSIDQLKNAEGMTFLERAPRTALSPLNYDLIADKYENTLHLKPDQANRLAASTKGYAFAFQVIGYFCWENKRNHKKALEEAKAYLYEFAYAKIWSELSEKDKQFIIAVSRVPSGKILLIRELLHISTNQFNPCRDRLLKSGVVYSPAPGFLAFALPWFDEYAVHSSELENTF